MLKIPLQVGTAADGKMNAFGKVGEVDGVGRMDGVDGVDEGVLYASIQFLVSFL